MGERGEHFGNSDSSGDEEMRKIHKYCRKLKNLNISGDPLDSVAYTQFLVCYGGQRIQILGKLFVSVAFDIYPEYDGDHSDLIRAWN